jgi:hypothetical protein
MMLVTRKRTQTTDSHCPRDSYAVAIAGHPLTTGRILVADCRFRGTTDMRPLKRADCIDANDPNQSSVGLGICIAAVSTNALGLAIDDKKTRPAMCLRSAHDLADGPELIDFLDARAEACGDALHV